MFARARGTTAVCWADAPWSKQRSHVVPCKRSSKKTCSTSRRTPRTAAAGVRVLPKRCRSARAVAAGLCFLYSNSDAEQLLFRYYNLLYYIDGFFLIVYEKAGSPRTSATVTPPYFVSILRSPAPVSMHRNLRGPGFPSLRQFRPLRSMSCMCVDERVLSM